MTKTKSRKSSASAISRNQRKQYVYAFGARTDGNAGMRNLLGGKGANLAEMAAIGLPVPPGFTISTEVCTYFYDHEKRYPKTLEKDVSKAIGDIEKQLGKTFGGRKNPLLVSVRSGARESMPGMMDTILNLGLNDDTVEGLAEVSNNPRFAWDCYRRFIQMYGDVVMGVRPLNEDSEEPFDAILENLKAKVGVESDTELTTEHLQNLVKQFKALIKKRTRSEFPQDAMEQLWGAVGAAEATGIALAATVGLMAALMLWRQVFDLGPFEWVLRRITRHGLPR